MSTNKSNKKQTHIPKESTDKVKDYSNDPFFLQQAEKAKKVIEKYGLPKEFIEWRDKQDNRK